MKSLRLILCVFSLSTSSFDVGLAGMIRHDTDIARYRDLGSRPAFNCVARYSSTISSNDYAVGVLIADRWILTASHFIGDTSVWMLGGAQYMSKRIVRHPKLVPGASEMQWTGWDLALVELTEPVTGIAPAKRYYGNDEVGKTITKIGYGYIGDGIHGLKTPRESERLGGHNVIDAAGGTFESRSFSTDVLVFDFDSPISSAANKFGSAEPLELEIGGSKGDSGGGVFIYADGEWKLAGIVSGALNREIKYGAVAALARVSSANDWIDSVISAVPKK